MQSICGFPIGAGRSVSLTWLTMTDSRNHPPSLPLDLVGGLHQGRLESLLYHFLQDLVLTLSRNAARALSALHALGRTLTFSCTRSSLSMSMQVSEQQRSKKVATGLS